MAIVDHPLRQELNDEVHARPPEAMTAPLRSTYIAMLSPWENSDRERQLVSELAQRFGGPPARDRATHYSAELAGFSLRWERHGEFARYLFTARAGSEDLFSSVAGERVPKEWLSQLPGERLVAANIAVVLLSGVRLLVQIASIPGQSASLHLLFAACAALCISRMATVISLMPMGIGVREASLGASLVGLGVPLPVALFVVVTDRVVITLPYLAISLASAPLLAGKLRQRQPPRDATGDAAAPSDATQGGNRDRF